MITAEQLKALEQAAESWKGTPFCEGAPVKGAGVSCHHVVAQVYMESGLMPCVPIPNGPSHWSPANARSLIVEWIEASGLFVQISAGLHGCALAQQAKPGDVLGFRVCNAIHHAAIQLSGGRIVHSVLKHGVRIPPCIPHDWERRLEGLWRLKSLASS
jgi:cell wall-associated NlpC family hydrolase